VDVVVGVGVPRAPRQCARPSCRRGDDVGTGSGVGLRLFGQHRHGFVVEDVAAIVDQAVLPWLV